MSFRRRKMCSCHIAKLAAGRFLQRTGIPSPAFQNLLLLPESAFCAAGLIHAKANLLFSLFFQFQPGELRLQVSCKRAPGKIGAKQPQRSRRAGDSAPCPKRFHIFLIIRFAFPRPRCIIARHVAQLVEQRVWECARPALRALCARHEGALLFRPLGDSINLSFLCQRHIISRLHLRKAHWDQRVFRIVERPG